MESKSGEQWEKPEFGGIGCQFWDQNGGIQERGVLGTVESAAGEGCYGRLLFDLACSASRVRVDIKGCKVKMKPMSQVLGMLCAFCPCAGCSVPPQLLSLRQVQMCKAEVKGSGGFLKGWQKGRQRLQAEDFSISMASTDKLSKEDKLLSIISCRDTHQKG